jgi:modulator of FtsH protease HflK
MTKQTQVSPRRAEILSLLAFGLHLLFFLLVLYLSSRTNTLAGKITAWHFLGGTIIWLMLLLQFRQRRLADEERLDAEQYQRLRREGKDKSVFEGTVVEDALHIAQRRLDWMEKYLVNAFAVAIVLYLLGIGYWLLTQVQGAADTVLAPQTVVLETMASLAVIGIISFLFSRYAVGMSQQGQWRPLRAGGSYLFSNSLLCFVLAGILWWANAGNMTAEKVVSYVLVGLLLALGVEIVLNLVLDAFRPRVKGQYRRAAYESRILGLFSEPGGILKTFAHAIDYQFGFKVSETWFYRLLEKAIVPLLLIQLFALYLLSCFTVVPPGSEGVLERWGEPENLENPYTSGLHVTLPWPIDKVRLFPKEQIQILEVGFDRGAHEEESQKPLLWTIKHWEAEYPFMVAIADPNRAYPEALPEASETGGATTRTDLDLLVIPLVVHYRIRDVGQYGYGADRCYSDPRELLKLISSQEVLHYSAHSDMETLMGPGREQTTQALQEAIQARADAYKMGVEIVFAGMETIHPPVEVAPEFEKVVSALQDKQGAILKARGEAKEILAQAKGISSDLISQSRAYQFERSTVAAAEAKRFTQQIQAYRDGGSIYLEREYLSLLDELLPSRRKYVMDSDAIDSWVYEYDLKEKLEPDLFRDIKIPTSEQESSK